MEDSSIVVIAKEGTVNTSPPSALKTISKKVIELLKLYVCMFLCSYRMYNTLHITRVCPLHSLSPVAFIALH